MKEGKVGYFIIGSTIIWGAVLIARALKLKGTGYYDDISPILIGGTLAHLLFIWVIIGALSRKNKKKKNRNRVLSIHKVISG